MPSYIPEKEKNYFLLWFIIAVVILIGLYAMYSSPFFMIMIPIIILWGFSLSKKEKIKYEKLAEERKDKSICNFSRSFNCREVDTWVLRAVYEQIQEYISNKNNPVAIDADDHLYDTLDIDEEDLEMDLLEEIFQRTNRSTENTEKNSFYGKVETVRDLVLFINEQPLLKNT